MKPVILDFPKQFKKGAEVAKDVEIKGDFKRLVICGIGGSALPGSLLMDMAIDLKMPLYIHRDYNLPARISFASSDAGGPKSADKDSLILCISYSGNTEEAVSSYKEAIDKGYQVIAISTGGKLQEIAQENDLPIVLIPQTGIQPRSATGYLVSAVLQVLENCGIVQGEVKKLLEVADNLKPESFEEEGKALAEKLVGKIPVVYASADYKALARIWKIKFNENSKVMAFWNYFPELNHNEMVGACATNSKGQIANSNFYFLILKDNDDDPRVLRRMEITADLIREAGAGVDFIEIYGKIKAEKIFSTLLLGDWVSYYLALAYHQDPTPVQIVEDFKKRLAS